MRYVVWGIGLFILLSTMVWAQKAPDPQVRKAQQELRTHGYDSGVADGIFGQRTRTAIEAFQRDKKLPVTGMLDEPTWQALGLAESGDATAAGKTPLISARTPLRLVLDYLRFYDTQPARLIPYITADFRGDLSPHDWMEQIVKTVASQEYARLSWQVQHVDMETDTKAIVHVRSHIRSEQRESNRQETFTLVRPTPDDAWKIDTWQDQEASLADQK